MTIPRVQTCKRLATVRFTGRLVKPFVRSAARCLAENSCSENPCCHARSSCRDDVLSIGMSRHSLLTLPGTLYYCLGNISEDPVDPIDPQDCRGNVPFASGLVHSLGIFRTCDSTRTRSKNRFRRPRQQ